MIAFLLMLVVGFCAIAVVIWACCRMSQLVEDEG